MCRNLIIAIILFILIMISCKKSEINQFNVMNGNIDISDNSFNAGQISLKGNWKFKWMEDNDDFIAVDYNDDNWDTLNVPGYWNYKVKKNYGYCWLRVKIKNNLTKDLGLFLNNANTAYKLYINGNLAMQNGNPGNSKVESEAQTFPLYINLPKTEYITIAWKISNYDINNGGPMYAPIIDDINKIIYSFWFNKLKDAIVIGFILMIAFYNLIIWFCRKKEKASLYLSLFCFIVCARFLITTRIFESIFYFINLFEYIKKAEYLTMTLAPLLFLVVVKNLFDYCFNKKVYTILNIIQIILSLFIFFTPLAIYSRFLLLYQIFILIYCIYIIIITIRLILNKVNDSLLFLFGFIILAFTALNDILINIFILHNVNLLQIGVIIFIIIPTILLNIRLARAYKTAEYLSNNLRTEVENQTNKISNLMQQKTALFINLAHETKTPLTLIQNYLDKYLESHSPNQELAVVKANIDKLTRDMVNFLDAEKIEQEKLLYSAAEWFDLSELLRQRMLIFTPLAEKKQITLQSLVTDGIKLKADPYALDRVINNLMDNAIRYTQEQGKVSVSLERRGDKHIAIVVEDNGTGIPAAQQPYIFDKYYQISQQKKNIQGMGMGLFITRSIVEAMQGKICFQSEEGKGTVFEVILAASGTEGTAADEIRSSNPGISPVLSNPVAIPDMHNLTPLPYDPARFTVLVVEDNLDLLTFLKQELESKYNVITALNGKAALESINSQPIYDLVISDIMMDEMDGFTFYSKFTKIEDCRQIPFIFLTAKTMMKDKLKGLEMGAVDYIYKPFYMDELLKKVEAHLQIRNVRKLIQEKEKYATLGKLVAGISHQLFNPLTFLKSPVEWLTKNLKNVPNSDKYLTRLNRINEGVIRIENLIDSLRILNYNKDSEEIEINVLQIINSVITLLDQNLREHIIFNIGIDADFVIKGNANSLTHIFMNLINNAVDAIKDKGTISINKKQVNQDLFIEIADTGIGIEEKNLLKVFDMDFTTKGFGIGTGMGLYIVKDLVNKMKWEINVTSKVNKGTTFTLIKRNLYFTDYS